MGRWRWEGFDNNGKRINSSDEAKSEGELRRILRQRGIKPIKVKPPSILEIDLNQFLIEKGFSKPFGPKDLASFTRQFSTMLEAGVPILQALEILFKQEKQPSLKISIKDMMQRVGEGKTLAESMSKQKGFDKLYCNLVKAGEIGGVLADIFQKLSIFLDKREKIKGQIKSAMSYPAIVVSIGVVVIWGMLTFVVPKMTEMLKDSGQELPSVTKFVVDASQFLQDYTRYIIPAVIMGIIFLTKFVKTPSGKIIFDRAMMKMPIFGPVIIKGNLTNFTRTLATMLTSGVSLIDALEICANTVDSSVISKDISIARKAVTEGKTLTEPLSKIDYFPDMVTQMIKIGETTGNMDTMLFKVAEIFEQETEALIGGMTKMIEPIIIVVLGGFVALILVAMYLPVFMAAGGN